MDEVVPGLWIGDLSAAVANDELEKNNIKFILSAMRGRVKLNPMLRRHQIPLDDSPDTDVLEHIPACNALIEAALSRGEGILVHCQAGMSRSATIVAAFLMYSQNLDRDSAIKLIQQARPSVAPNVGFMEQLELYQSASFKVSGRDKNIRKFYLDRSVKEILNGDGSDIRSDMFAGFPRSATPSAPVTPGGGPRRRIRCKMCRYDVPAIPFAIRYTNQFSSRRELAAREHMMDHGQLSPPTPNERSRASSRASSLGEGARGPKSSVLLGLKMSSIDAEVLEDEKLVRASQKSTRSGVQGESVTQNASANLSMTGLPNRGHEGTVSISRRSSQGSATATLRSLSSGDGIKSRSVLPSSLMMSSMSESAFVDSDGEDEQTINEAPAAEVQEDSGDTHESGPSTDPLPDGPVLLSPGEISAQLPPSIAALRRSSLIAALHNSSPRRLSRADSFSLQPIIANPSCSGYFVEAVSESSEAAPMLSLILPLQMKWMDSFLGEGRMAGKIICPNEKCNAKLGNYDWAGVQCGCGQWVTPGFVIARGKVDEIS
ncbi:uncharacterized protein EI90DRAFT_3218374 [Cantharellus anzutake]|uniref:uncharacterized protein n=1 Tax=Cantharellus anzutake TaxID=1750568 RepID=UPI0019031677|nr:uncharacterized protein EI90DRAFT_3218374 [Cantharellus anzutake]KAF8328192.1 hypothetical protein EI90DRAFT_3218374 [Cantharellus anzutake]